jgi:transcription antitermination factor NusG
MDMIESFLGRERKADLQFRHNDCVRVITGRFEDSLGSLVTVLEAIPEPLYLMELDTGKYAKVRQSEIHLVDR